MHGFFYLLVCVSLLSFLGISFSGIISDFVRTDMPGPRKKAIVKREIIALALMLPTATFLAILIYNTSWPSAAKMVAMVIASFFAWGILVTLTKSLSSIEEELICPACGSFKVTRHVLEETKKGDSWKSEWNEIVTCAQCSHSWVVNVREEVHVYEE